MKDSIAFAKSCVDRIVNSFPNVRCRYEYHSLSYTHFIEVVPNKVYRLDKQYVALEEQLTDAFENKFPGEFISFISDTAIYKISRPIYVNQGSIYAKPLFIGVGYATDAELQNGYTNFKAILDSYLNVATNCSLVKMYEYRKGCAVKLEEPPPIVETILENIEDKTLYNTGSYYFA